MIAALFTGNQPRHIALANLLASIADEVYVVQETTSVAPPAAPSEADGSRSDYFVRMRAAEQRVFGRGGFLEANVRSLAVARSELRHVDLASLSPALDADAIVVFGASFIKPPLVDRLIARGAVNVHMGVSPYYRGAACNFWALYDGRPDLVGATIHLLSERLDAGDILFHAFPPATDTDPFELGMRAVESAHEGLRQWLVGQTSASDPQAQDEALEIRYSRGREFTDAIAAEYLGRLPTPALIGASLRARDMSRFHQPFVSELVT